MRRLTGLALLACASVAIAADADSDLASKMINTKHNGTWNIQPDKPKAKHFKVDGDAVPGGFAFRINATKGANPWDVQASSPIDGAINEGDVVMLMYYARAAEPAEGGSKLTARVQLAGAPYTSTLDFTSDVGAEWQQHCAHRVASATLPEKKGSVSIHLATAKQVIELGPVFVFNFGKGYDEKSLKGCDG